MSIFVIINRDNFKKALSILVAIVFVLTVAVAATATATASSQSSLDDAVSDVAAYVLRTVRNPQVDSVGGEWAIIGLARSGYYVPDSYYESYYKTVEQFAGENGEILHERKYTENSRVILSLTAAGYDPCDVAGYDLTAALGDFERTVWQGINGSAWALIALDCLDYPVPENKDAKTQATRELYIDEIIRAKLPDGGWSLATNSSGGASANVKGDADMTGTVLQALARYQSRPEVKAAIEKALAFLSGIQDDKTGGFLSAFSGGSMTLESTAQVLIALCELGVSIDDPRFVKDGKTLVDNILSYRNTNGSYKHTPDSIGANQMATEQALCALVAAQRAIEGENSLYRMSDTAWRDEPKVTETVGLPNKHADVNRNTVTLPGKTFADISDHVNKAAIEALAERGIITGKSENSFDPDATVTRAEFAALVTRALGFDTGQGAGTSETSEFSDVLPGAWYFSAVQTAHHYGIVTGISSTMFNPDGTITRQEASVMTARAAKLVGMDTARSPLEIRDTLAAFGDYRSVANWAQEAMAFCYSSGILDNTEFDIEPGFAARRHEVAGMLYEMLARALLL
ncbi:MAG: S-layer homology domain-containing protein [Oscillospiraceae bacterium]|nr:S-layer homology domain-containing protein [Oscillospiraceae bacterium]